MGTPLCSGARSGEHAPSPGCSCDPVGPGPELLALLDRLRLSEWASFLAKCGAVEIDDLRWIDESQLIDAGMLIVPCRKLRAAALGDEAGARAALARARLAAALDGAGPDNGSCVNCGFPHSSVFSRDSSRHAGDPMPPQLVGPGAPIDIRVAVGAGDEHPTAEADPDMARLAFTARQARATARTSLAAVLMAREPLSEEVVTCLIYAKGIADHTDAPPELVAKALAAVSRAVACCPPGPLNLSISTAEKSVRDLLIWKTQLGCTLGDRQAFVDALTLAVGAEHINTNMFSHLLHAHNKEVCPRFPDAFLSNAARAARRRRARTRRP